MSKSPRFILGGMCFVAILVCLFAPLMGMKMISLKSAFSQSLDSMDVDILWRIRIPRVCLSFLAGGGLALSGMAFQAIFRNPLATPFTLGVASGASLGATLCLKTGLLFTVFGLSSISLAAFGGALLSVVLVYGLTLAARGFSTAILLLSGVAMSFFFSSLILFIQYMSDFTESFRILRWLMGGLEVVGFEEVFNLAPFILMGSLIVFFLHNELNLLLTGEEIALSRGIDVSRIRKVLFITTSIMVGGVVAVCGPIGFVGMMAPHICRLMIGNDHRYLTLASFLFGGILLTVCDTLARTLIAPTEIPVGVITAILGGPFFIWLLVSRGNSKNRVF